MYSLLLAIFLSLFTIHANAPKEQDTQLAEYSYDSDGPRITPIAVVRGGKLIDPIIYREPENDAKTTAFLKLNYPTGSKFTLYQSGQRMGSVQLDGQTGGCYSDFTQRAKPIGKLGIKLSSYTLATSRDLAESPLHLQREASADELSAFIQASRFSVSATYPAVTSNTRFKVHKLAWTSASKSGSPLLIGSISFINGRNEFWLFGIFKKDESGWHSAISEVHLLRDLEDRKDAIEENYLDQLDIDGDGIDEFFTTSTYYEGISYSAYGIRNGNWTKIFKGAYSGC